MRPVTSHKTGGFTTVNIDALDRTAPGVPTYRYDLSGFNTAFNNQATDGSGRAPMVTRLPIVFHNGPLLMDRPQNGVTAEALLAVLTDHLQGLQNSLESCIEYQTALSYLNSAKTALDRKIKVPYVSEMAINSPI